MSVWNPGVSLASVEERIAKEAVKFYKDEKTAADSLGINHKELLKILGRAGKEDLKREEYREEERKREKDYLLRARGITTTLV